MVWLAIAIGGAAGSVARYLVSVAIFQLYGETVPLAVAVVNIVGCFITGLGVGAATTGHWLPSETVRAFVFVGILGGFTTFSSFGLDTFNLIREGRLLVAGVNAIGQLIAGVAALYGGYALVAR
jgi:CrcB protein